MIQNFGFLLLWIGQVAAEPAFGAGQSEQCEIDVRLDLAGKKPPVILAKNSSNRYELAQPSIRTTDNSYINLTDQRFFITCPGNRNSLNLSDHPPTMATEASCMYTQGHNYFNIEGKAYQTDQVQCVKRVMPTESVTQESCNGNGALLKLGYMIEDDFYDLIQVCHRLTDGKTYFSKHILDGSHFPRTGNISKRPDDEGRPGFSHQNKALYRGFPPYKYFKVAAQQRLLRQITGNPNIIDQHHKKFFARGHLSPNADFILNTWRDVTFLYVNVQPQWQEINGEHWNEIETVIRKHAITTGEKYEVLTGTEGVLTLNSTDLYLDSTRKRLPVPEHYIKVVREIKSNKCVAFVSNNFPLTTRPTHKCEDSCVQYSWPDLKDYKKNGYVYCCSYEELETAFPKLFPAVNCTGGILKNEGHEGQGSTTDSSRLGTTTHSSPTKDDNILYSDSIGQNSKTLLPILVTASWVVSLM